MHVQPPAAASPPDRRHLLIGIWHLCDPKISLASIAAMILGACSSARIQPLDWSDLTLTVLGILMIEAAKNGSGEVVDFDSGTDQMVADEDRSPFSGGKRVIVDGLLSRRQTIAISGLFYLLGCSIGLWIVFTISPWVMAFGLVGVALGYFYHAAPLRLAYRGLGEAAVALAYGPIITCGTALVQIGRVPIQTMLLSVPFGLLIAAFLVINEFPDYRADQAAGKRNLVVRLGARRAKNLFLILQLIAYCCIAAMPLASLPASVLLGFIGLPFAWLSCRRLHCAATTSEIIPAQKHALLSFLLTALGMGIGVLL